jgi:hypothetical protein
MNRRFLALAMLLVLGGCSSTGYVARTDHFKIVRGVHTKSDVKLLMGEPLYDGPFRPTFTARELPAACPQDSTSFHYLSRYENVTKYFTRKYRQADVIHFDEKGRVCAVSSKACYAPNGLDDCYEDVEKGIEEPYSF